MAGKVVRKMTKIEPILQNIWQHKILLFKKIINKKEKYIDRNIKLTKTKMVSFLPK